MKKILFLGGSTQQIPPLIYAKEKGYYSILCDYLEDNPGQDYVDKFYCVSTTDKESILQIAKNEDIDGIVAYASDPAAPTAAYVGNKLNLPSNPYDSVVTLAEKDLFRKFLKDHGFNCPRARAFNNLNKAKEEIYAFKFPVMIKPTDSSGSKGVSKINSIDELDIAFNYAQNHSRSKKIIIEEFIEMAHEYMVGGDGFVLNGKFIFNGFLNCHRNKEVNPYVPVGKSYPVLLSKEKIRRAEQEIQKILDILDIKNGALNIELMFDKQDELYIIELGPRNGGNMIPDLLKKISGVDLIASTVEVALGNYNFNLEYQTSDTFYSTYNIHSKHDGILKDIIFKDEIQGNIVEKNFYTEQGQKVEKFTGANKALGIVFFKFDTLDEMVYKMTNINEYLKVCLD